MKRRSALVAALLSLTLTASIAAGRSIARDSGSIGTTSDSSRVTGLPATPRAPRTVEVTLTAAPARLALRPGKPSDVFAYNGTVPGPTLEVREGDRVIVHFRNNLKEASTVHWHGMHIPASEDGSALHPVPAGAQRDYTFTVPRGSAGTYWYHPHPHYNSGRQVGMGLYGALIVRADDDPLPASMAERILVLSDNRFMTDGTIDFPGTHTDQGRRDHENGREGDVLFVNGKVRPTLTIRSGEVQRWRIINTSASRIYRISFSGQTFLHVGNDGGLFERPVPVQELMVANAERVEILVRGTGKPGERVAVRTLPYDRYVPQTRPTSWNVPRDLLTLQYSAAAPVKEMALPTSLRVVPPLDTLKATATREIVFSQGLINGKTMDMNRVDVTAKLGATEIWKVENLVGMDHPFHLHGFQFQVLERNGVPEKFRSWKDLVNVPKHESIRLIVRYDDFPGKWMFHCHILEHEDQGMMGILEVKK